MQDHSNRCWSLSSEQQIASSKHQWCYQVTVSVQTWVLLRSACAFELWLLDRISAGTRVFNSAASCHQHVLLHWLLMPSSKLCQRPLLTEFVSLLGRVSIKLCTAASLVTNCILCFYWDMSKSLACHLMLHLDKLSIRQLLPDQLVTKKENKTRRSFNNYYFLR